jgi:hypothetical protein
VSETPRFPSALFDAVFDKKMILVVVLFYNNLY